MKKIFILFGFILISLILVACNKDDSKQVRLLGKERTTHSIIAHVHIPSAIDIKNDDELLEAAYQAAHLIYESEIDAIGSYQMDYIVYFYQNTQTYDSKGNAEYGSLVFIINQSVSTPGLSLISNNLKY